MSQLDILTSIAKTEPHAAYTGFVSGFKHKMTYFMRTIPKMADALRPLDEKLNKEFIPAITEGHVCSHTQRMLLSLPVRLGGMGIPILTELCESEYKNSKRATQQLTERIKSQQEKIWH